MGTWGYLLLGALGLGVLVLRPNWFPWLLLLGPLGLLAWWALSSGSGFAPDTDQEEDLDDPEPLWGPYSSDDDPLS